MKKGISVVLAVVMAVSVLSMGVPANVQASSDYLDLRTEEEKRIKWSPYLSQSEKEEYWQQQRILDVNRDGKVSYTEYQRTLEEAERMQENRDKKEALERKASNALDQNDPMTWVVTEFQAIAFSVTSDPRTEKYTQALKDLGTDNKIVDFLNKISDTADSTLRKIQKGEKVDPNEILREEITGIWKEQMNNLVTEGTGVVIDEFPVVSTAKEQVETVHDGVNILVTGSKLADLQYGSSISTFSGNSSRTLNSHTGGNRTRNKSIGGYSSWSSTSAVSSRSGRKTAGANSNSRGTGYVTGNGTGTVTTVNSGNRGQTVSNGMSASSSVLSGNGKSVSSAGTTGKGGSTGKASCSASGTKGADGSSSGTTGTGGSSSGTTETSGSNDDSGNSGDTDSTGTTGNTKSTGDTGNTGNTDNTGETGTISGTGNEKSGDDDGNESQGISFVLNLQPEYVYICEGSSDEARRILEVTGSNVIWGNESGTKNINYSAYSWQVSMDNGGSWQNVDSEGVDSGLSSFKQMLEDDASTICGLAAVYTADMKYNGYMYRLAMTDTEGNNSYSNTSKLTVLEKPHSQGNYTLDNVPSVIEAYEDRAAGNFYVYPGINCIGGYLQYSDDNGTSWKSIDNPSLDPDGILSGSGFYGARSSIVLQASDGLYFSIGHVKLSHNGYQYRMVFIDENEIEHYSNPMTLKVNPAVATGTSAEDTQGSVAETGTEDTEEDGVESGFEDMQESEAECGSEVLSEGVAETGGEVDAEILP